MKIMTTDINTENDWTLDTNVIINANSGDPCVLELLDVIGKCGMVCWNKSIVQEYIARGAIHLLQAIPPIIASGRINQTVMDAWLSRPNSQANIKPIKPNRFSTIEVERLEKGGFRDPDDHWFIETARASMSKRLVTQERHYNEITIPHIHALFSVRCMEYQPALDECKLADH